MILDSQNLAGAIWLNHHAISDKQGTFDTRNDTYTNQGRNPALLERDGTRSVIAANGGNTKLKNGDSLIYLVPDPEDPKKAVEGYTIEVCVHNGNCQAFFLKDLEERLPTQVVSQQDIHTGPIAAYRPQQKFV